MKLHKSLEKGMKDCKEGRTYIYSCRHVKKGKMKGITWICWDCHTEDCKKWYLLGRKDERKKLKKAKSK
jgi:hypothetical protein